MSAQTSGLQHACPPDRQDEGPRVGADDLAGTLLLAPGVDVPHNLRSTRRALAPRIARGQLAGTLPGLLGSLFNLCGQAHRLCNSLALNTIAPGLLPAMPPAQTLQRETAAEHVRRIGLDWPRLLVKPASACAASALRDLRECPLLIAPAGGPLPWGEVRDWLQTRWLHMAPVTWLQNWQTDGAGWLHVWSQRHDNWLSALVRAARSADSHLALNADTALQPHGLAGGLRELGEYLARQGEAAPVQPRWNGRPAHTGVWSRLHAGAQPGPSSAWALLGSRIAELIRLCLPDEPGYGGALWLHWGARPSGPDQGLAWVEMARGLLIHQVRLDSTNTGVPRVADCQVLAPTEWNFHPEGVAAQALARLPRETDEPGPRVCLLMAALDPCVPFRLDDTAVYPVSRWRKAMHEVSLAGGVLQLVEETARRDGFTRLLALRLEAGQLAGVDARALRFALESLAPGTLLEGAHIDIEEPPGQAWCMACARSVPIAQRGTPCPACGGYQLQPTGGMELRVLDMRVSDDASGPQ